MALKCEVLGDVNGDGKIDGFDTMLVLNHVAGFIELSGDEKWRANVDQDLEISISDARRILQHNLGANIIDNIRIITD